MNDIAFIYLKNVDRFTVVDADQFSRLNRHSWCLDRNGYVVRVIRTSRGTKRKLLLHRECNSTPGYLMTDHRDGNKLNNTSANLRSATSPQNMQNSLKRRSQRGAIPTSHFKGVSRQKGRNRWRGTIVVNGVHRNLGSFKLESDAAEAYDAACRQTFGEFARANET